MNIEPFLCNTDENLTFHSNINDNVKKEECMLGIDEAGRGPVLGPMVYGACFCPLSNEEDLTNLGCDDSKVLKEEQREKLFSSINEITPDFMGWIITILSPNYLSTSMLSRTKYNLNSISHDTAINLIKTAIKLGVKVKKVFVDTVGPPEKYQDKLQRIFPNLEIIVEKKADSKFPIVSAASICAKVCRDRTLTNWRFKESHDIDSQYGSGYPGDAVTKLWLRKNVDRVFGFPTIVRFSWATAQSILEEEAVSVEWPDDDDDDDAKPSNVPAITSYFNIKKAPNERHEFFTRNKLSLVETLQ